MLIDAYTESSLYEIPLVGRAINAGAWKTINDYLDKD